MPFSIVEVLYSRISAGSLPLIQQQVPGTFEQCSSKHFSQPNRRALYNLFHMPSTSVDRSRLFTLGCQRLSRCFARHDDQLFALDNPEHLPSWRLDIED